MTPDEWKNVCDRVTDSMRGHTRPFVTPLSTSNDDHVRLVGSGSYVEVHGRPILLTCEHVARNAPMEYRFYGSESVFRYPRPFTMEPHPIDAAFALITNDAWNAARHKATPIPYARFAPKHNIADPCEILFFRGYAGQNSHYGFGIHEANGSGYCSQEKHGIDFDRQIFEVFWEPANVEVTRGSSPEARATMMHDDPHGFSGSLVWNTRFMELSNAGQEWTPDAAVVTGLLRRFDPSSRTLLVLRVEHLNAWVNIHMPFEWRCCGFSFPLFCDSSVGSGE